MPATEEKQIIKALKKYTKYAIIIADFVNNIYSEDNYEHSMFRP